MAGKTHAAQNAVLNCYLNQTNITAPTAIYLGLFSSNPTDAGGGTELSGNNYSRTNVTTSFPTASGTSGSVSNNVQVDTATASGTWDAVTGWGLFDASSNGTLLYWGPCSLSSIGVNAFHRFPIGSITVTED